MSIFVTGTTGYIGSYIAHGLLSKHKERLALLVRAKNEEEARQRLWRSFQLHMDFQEFSEYLNKIDLFLGDLTLPNLGLTDEVRDQLIHKTDSVIHCAASLNRKSEKACLNVNLRGTLQVIKIARAAQDHHGIRRFSDVSTVAVAGKRQDEVVTEDASIDWNRSDYDPYARTKKFCEHMVHELLPDVNSIVFRPSIVLGDSRFPQTTQFDMVRAFVFLAQFPILPFKPKARLDIVPADYVGKAIVEIHQSENAKHGIYHLSSGTQSLNYERILESMYSGGFKMRHWLAPWMLPLFHLTTNALMATPRALGISQMASLMKVFFPYLTFNTVFDNSRVTEALGEAPKPFSEYALPLLQFSKDNNFTYPYKPYGEELKAEAA